MTFNLLGPPTKDDIKVAYIDPAIGLVEGVSICQANEYAKKEPGTTFIFKNGNQVIQYLNINEINSLDPNVLISTDECGGISQNTECGPPSIQIYGGGGIGAVGNPIIGNDGALLAVDVVRGGNGYQFPPLVTARDNCNYGSGSTLTAILGEVTETIETYENEADFENYELCEPTDVGYGRRYGPNGEDLGPWEPSTYAEPGKDPIKREVEEFEKIVRRLARAPFWSTRKAKPTKIICSDPIVIPSKYDVTFPAWNEFMNTYAISPKPPSNTRGSDFAGRVFTFEWTEDFPTDGEYIFRGLCDNQAQLYVDNLKVTDLSGFNSPVIPIQKTFRKGFHNIRVDLLNIPILETVTTQETQVVGGYFHLMGSGYYLKVGGNDRVQLSFKLDWSGTGDPSKTAITKITIPTEEGSPVVLTRSKSGNVFTTTGSSSGSGIFKANKDYGPIIFEGATGTVPPKIINVGNVNVDPGAFQQAIEFQDSNDNNNDVDARLDIIGNSGVQLSGARTTASTPTPTSSNSPSVQVKKVFNTLDFISKANRTLWRTNVYGRGGFINEVGVCPFDTSVTLPDNPYAGTHTIVWNNINFPIDGFYRIRMAVDDSVTLFIGEEQIKYEGFIGGTNNPNLEFNESKFFKAGNYAVRADLKQISGGQFGFSSSKNINPMALAIDIETTTVTETTISPKSWNENPMGISVTIDAPEPPVPQEPIPEQEGRCPNNPIWTTRFPGAKESWYPVQFNGSKSPQGKQNPWGKFLNRYGISPVRPLDTPGSDGGGILFTNSWELEIPYDGFYQFAVERDNTARIYVDGNLAFDVTTSGDDRWKDFRDKPKFQKVFIAKGRHTIGVELENTKSESFEQVYQKIFRTKDWQVEAKKVTQTTDVNFNIVTSQKSTFVSSFKISELGIDVYKPSKTLVNQTIPKKVEVGKIYTIEVVVPQSANVSLEVKGNTLEMEELGKNTSRDLYCTISNGRFFDVQNGASKATCKFVVDDNQPVLTGLSGGTAKDGVTYEGPPLFAYKDNRWGTFMNNHSISPLLPPLNADNPQINGVKTYSWKGVNFPESGQYDITFQADNDASLIINGIKIVSSQGFENNPQIFKVNLTQGTYNVVVECNNIPDTTNIFNNNPTGFALVVSKNISVRSNYGKSWDENPMGIGAILIPPPCPKRIRGKGVVTDIIVNDPGNGYLRPIPKDQGYSVALRLKEVFVENPGINYNCGVDELRITPSNGAELDYICDPFGKIREVKVLNPGLGFTVYPEIRMVSPTGPTGPTGVNASFRPVFEVVRDPIVRPEKLIQVTDLVGLKQTGYVDGRAYYGTVYYDQGVRFAGFYETVGEPVRVYDTLQESITAQITTPASAIQRQGTDVTSNDPRLNIPGTPQNLN